MSRRLKRLLDVTGAAIALMIAAPLMLLAAAAILIFDGQPIFWTQVRSGARGRAFKLWKFRTMSNARDSQGRLLDDRCRLTKTGAILRAWSLDELPQLWNVLKNDMSLVGPRPLIPVYQERYDAVQKLRLEVQPGLTGWCQVQGRNALSWESKFALDALYVMHWSLGLDLKILALTVPAVLRRQGISQPGHTTMPDFFGNIRRT